MTSLSDAVYKQTEWEHIAEATNLPDGRADETLQPLTVKHDGVWSDGWGNDTLDWHPYVELDEPITKSPAHHPYLPFPLSARDLAAFMLDGLGYFVRSRFGEWADGPCEEILNEMPAKALTAKHAIRCAFQAYREALAEVGDLDPAFEQRVTELRSIEDSARIEARAQLGFEKMAESSLYKEASEATRQARRNADAAAAAWRKKMVQRLLRPEPDSNGAAITARVTPKHRPEQTPDGHTGTFLASPENQLHRMAPRKQSVEIVLPYRSDGFYRFGDLAWLISQALCPDDENAKNWLRCVYTWRDDGSPDGLFQRRLAPDGCLTEDVLEANHWPSETVQPSRVDTEPGSLLFHWLWAEQRRGSEWHQFLSGGELVIHCDDEPKRSLLEATRRQHMLQYERELEAAAQSGLLMVCNSSGLPLTFRHGEPLQNGMVHVDSLNEWGATLPGRQRFEMVQASAERTYVLPIFARLKPSTEWRGGRISDTDALTLAEAAKQASAHAGQSVSEQDFLRAAGRGEIHLRAIAKRSAKVKSLTGGAFCNVGTSNENIVPSGSIPTLPLTACEQLAAAGRASWRTFDGFEFIDGQMMRYTAAALTEDEPSFETVPEDCRVTGNDVHALADAFIAPLSTSEPQQQAKDKQQVPSTSATTPPRIGWKVALPYMVAVLRNGQYATAKALYNALLAAAGDESSPFSQGTGQNRGSLFVKEIGATLALKTVQNAWGDLKAAAREGG